MKEMDATKLESGHMMAGDSLICFTGRVTLAIHGDIYEGTDIGGMLSYNAVRGTDDPMHSILYYSLSPSLHVVIDDPVTP